LFITTRKISLLVMISTTAIPSSVCLNRKKESSRVAIGTNEETLEAREGETRNVERKCRIVTHTSGRRHEMG